jgi:anaerobic selenocysteine-containing dehydrogenase
MDNSKINRREFLGKTSALFTVAAIGGVASSSAKAGFHFEMDSNTEGQCATCKYWGGIRKLSKDGKTVSAQSLGYCNNPESYNYQKTTSPETGPMKKWSKWGAIS